MTIEYEITCPFCGESYPIVVDCSVADQTYIEDCFVCCRPITFHIQCEDEEVVSVTTARE